MLQAATSAAAHVRAGPPPANADSVGRQRAASAATPTYRRPHRAIVGRHGWPAAAAPLEHGGQAPRPPGCRRPGGSPGPASVAATAAVTAVRNALGPAGTTVATAATVAAAGSSAAFRTRPAVAATTTLTDKTGSAEFAADRDHHPDPPAGWITTWPAGSPTPSRPASGCRSGAVTSAGEGEGQLAGSTSLGGIAKQEAEPWLKSFLVGN